jgi:hypothetical protein
LADPPQQAVAADRAADRGGRIGLAPGCGDDLPYKEFDDEDIVRLNGEQQVDRVAFGAAARVRRYE